MTATFHLDVQDGVRLAGEREGDGPPVVLLHGLTATRRYVLMGSRYLARHGFELVGYDARGHGASTGAGDPDRYEYEDLAGDLDRIVDEPAVLVGNSMGGATATLFTLRHPERVRALVHVTPGYGGPKGESDIADWDRMAAGMERHGVEGFMRAYDPPSDPHWRETALKFTRQRLERHEHPDAVAAALRVVPRSRAYEMDELEAITTPTLIVGSRDESDPGHPRALAEEYAERIPGAKLLLEEEGKSPLAWQGAQLSRAIQEFLAEQDVA